MGRLVWQIVLCERTLALVGSLISVRALDRGDDRLLLPLAKILSSSTVLGDLGDSFGNDCLPLHFTTGTDPASPRLCCTYSREPFVTVVKITISLDGVL